MVGPAARFEWIVSAQLDLIPAVRRVRLEYTGRSMKWHTPVRRLLAPDSVRAPRGPRVEKLCDYWCRPGPEVTDPFFSRERKGKENERVC